MALQQLSSSDNLQTWWTKINQAIDAINNLNPTNVFSLQSPVSDQDILVYESSTGLFTNQHIAAFLASIIAANQAAIVNNPMQYFLSNQRTLF